MKKGYFRAIFYALAVMGGGLLPGLGANVAYATGTSIYVNCSTGNNSNNGDINHPKATLSFLGSAQSAGTTVYLAKGCSWGGAVNLQGTGTSGSPIVITSYGSGAAPILTGSGVSAGNPTLTMSGAYQTVSNIHISGSTHAFGITVNGTHGTVSNTEINGVGEGIKFAGTYGYASYVNVHDLNMVVDTAGGDDDYGAVGFDIQANNVEIGYSSCTHCRATSHDYGYDGGFAEVWNAGDYLLIHDSTGSDTQGVMEFGADTSTKTANHVVVYNNSFTNAHGGFYIHSGDAFAISVSDFVIDTNYIENTGASDNPVLDGDVSNIVLEANDISIAGGQVSYIGAPSTHIWNNYYIAAGANVGYSLGTGEVIY